MNHKNNALLTALCAAAVLAAPPAASQSKIVCWKDKSGKVVGCGDSVPPEYQESATKELDKRGITRKSTVSAQEEARQRAQAEEAAKAKAEQDKRAAEQKRQDSALLATYANELEIDGKRDRDLQVIDLQMSQLRVSQKNAADRHRDARSRLEAAEKSRKGGLEALKDETARAADEMRRLDQSVAAKEKEKDAIRARYAEYRKRYAELKSGAQPLPPAGPKK